MEKSEKKLIKLIKLGDKESFGILYDRYIEKIYQYIYYKTHHKETAEDLTSLTFVKSLDYLPGFNEDNGNFKAWLYRIARNNIIDHYRTKKIEYNIGVSLNIHTFAIKQHLRLKQIAHSLK